MVISPSDSSRRRIIMSKYIPGNQKHLTLNDRIYTENELAKGTSFKDIATFLCKDPTTISKEVRAHRISDWYHKGTFYNSKNFCIHRYHCKVCFFLFLLYGDRSKNNSSICSFDKSSLCRMAIISSCLGCPSVKRYSARTLISLSYISLLSLLHQGTILLL